MRLIVCTCLIMLWLGLDLCQLCVVFLKQFLMFELIYIWCWLIMACLFNMFYDVAHGLNGVWCVYAVRVIICNAIIMLPLYNYLYVWVHDTYWCNIMCYMISESMCLVCVHQCVWLFTMCVWVWLTRSLILSLCCFVVCFYVMGTILICIDCWWHVSVVDYMCMCVCCA